MTPVISPWVFYLMPICENVSFFCGLTGALCLIGLTVVCIAITVDRTTYDDEGTQKALRGARRVLLPITVVLILGSLFVPTESTITKMLVAQNVTYERVEVAADTVRNVYEDIMELFEEGEDEGR